jgi:hypothetical protein
MPITGPLVTKISKAPANAGAFNVQEKLALTLSSIKAPGIGRELQSEDKDDFKYLSTDNWLFSCLPRGEQLLENVNN